MIEGLSLLKEGGIIFSIELVICYSNFFIERVFVYPSQTSTITERTFIYQYEGPLRYRCPTDVYPQARLVQLPNQDGVVFVLLRDEDNNICLYNLK